MTSAHSRSYQSIKVEHPDDDAAYLIRYEVRPEPSFKTTKGLLFVTALCAAILVGVVSSFSRTDEFAYANSPSGMSLNVDEAFLLMPEEDEDFLNFPISELSALPSKQCFRPAGVPVGPAGHVYIKSESAFAGLSFERKGNNCDCSYVSSVFKLLIASTFISLSQQRYIPMKLNLVLNRPPYRLKLSVNSMIPYLVTANAVLS